MNLREIINLEERTIGEFEKIQSLLNTDVLDKNELINNIITIMEQLNIDDEIIDNITAKDIKDFVEYLNEPVEYDNYFNTFELDNVIYEIEDDYQLKGARTINTLYKKLLENKDFTSYCLAVIFTDEYKTTKENLDPELIKKKQRYIKTLRAKDYLYHVMNVTNQIIEANIDINDNK